ncbi:hypothetical protein [Thermithiobacillus plumbiphilus]|uniref:DUF2271 domain-containing protein n=1 Tax=Thermithiobacillus plumbiphilus TaxID=1729899 RepID=A0ABU9D9A5_9PROT
MKQIQSAMLSILLLASPVWADPPQGAVRELDFHLSARSPEQLAAFYSARGFPESAIQALGKICFLTVGMRNETSQIVWLALDRWRITDAEGRAVPRLTRTDWQQRWDAIDLPPGNRATFNWTQLPEQRDLQPGEPVGGNLAILPPAGPFSLEASFRTGAEKTGPVLKIQVDNLRCPSADASHGEQP